MMMSKLSVTIARQRTRQISEPPCSSRALWGVGHEVSANVLRLLAGLVSLDDTRARHRVD